MFFMRREIVLKYSIMENKKSLSQIEQDLINFWDKEKIFEKFLKNNLSRAKAEKKTFSFFDGPPFASGSPHYGHIMVSFIKDAVLKYWSLRGFSVEQTFGWDCHGLPVELYVEKKIGIKSKKDIFKLGENEYKSIEKFNEICKNSVFDCIDEWHQMFKRIGRWGDFKNAYSTMDNKYIESVWWVFKELWNKKLVYQGYKSMHICPRCETPLSNFEVTQGYKDVTDLSVYVKFKLLDGLYAGAFALAWTTTPWTLPGNMFLALNKNIKYVIAESDGQKYILSKGRVADVFKDKQYKIIGDVKVKDLEGVRYESLFPYFKNKTDCYYIVLADFVSAEEGTGIVHIAPAFGEDDLQIGLREKIEPICHVKVDGTFVDEVVQWAGKFVKNQDTNIKDYLDKEGKLFYFENFTHSYPHCWRCDTPLLNYSTKAWFVKVTALKNKLIKNNKEIKWVPEHIRDGRFGEWLNEARDWVVSRNRFWGAPVPVWVCKCNEIKVIGSVEEVEKLSEKKISNLHRPYVDEMVFKCDKCGGEMKRTEEVLDCWFESGSMPYAQYHYPFENQQKFKKTFPADFIAESLDQTRGWFYTLNILSTALFDRPSFKNVIVNGLILDANGKKLSKKLKNYPDPNFIFEKYGVDALRYFIIKNTAPGENTRFDEDLLRESQKELVFPILNSLNFFNMVSELWEAGNEKENEKNTNILDEWIEIKMQKLINEVNEYMENYDLRKSLELITGFVNNDLNNWYIKLSRDRLKFKENPIVLGKSLINLSIIITPFMPFIAEHIYQNLKNTFLKKYYKFKLSVFLEKISENIKNDKLVANVDKQMSIIQKIVSLGLRIRKENNLSVRLPLYIAYINQEIKNEFQELIKEALNIRDIKIKTNAGILSDVIEINDEGVSVGLLTKTDENLINEKIIREFIRQLNNLRREEGLTIKDKVDIQIYCENKKLRELIEQNISVILPKIFSGKIDFTEQGLDESRAISIEKKQLKIRFSAPKTINRFRQLNIKFIK